jgi:prophage regulatory protein
MYEQKPLDRMVRKPELLKRINVSDATVWRWEKLGKFPRRIWLGGNSVAWLESELQEWFTKKAANRE